MLRTAQSLPLTGLLTLRFDPGGFPPEAGSLLPGLLTATRTGPSPADDDELMLDQLLNKHLQLWAHAEMDETQASGGPVAGSCLPPKLASRPRSVNSSGGRLAKATSPTEHG